MTSILVPKVQPGRRVVPQLSSHHKVAAANLVPSEDEDGGNSIPGESDYDDDDDLDGSGSGTDLFGSETGDERDNGSEPGKKPLSPPPPDTMTARERELFQNTMQNVRKRHQHNVDTFERYGEQPQDVYIKRQRVAAINSSMLDPTTGKTKPASTPGEHKLRNQLATPYDELDEERIQEEDDTGLFLTSVPVPGRERREMDLAYPQDEADQSCYGCDSGLFADARPTVDALGIVVDLYRRNRGTCKSPALATQMAKAYDEVRDKHNLNVERHEKHNPSASNVSTKKLPDWPVRMIYDHITDHMITNPDVYVQETTRMLHEMNEAILHGGVYRMDIKRPGKAFLHKGSAKMLLANINTQLRLMTTPSKRMNGYTSNMTVISTPGVISAPKTTSTQDRLKNVFDFGD